MNVPFTKLEMCTNVIPSLPLLILTGSYAQKGMHFPTKLNTLKEDLIRVAASVQRHDKMIADIRANGPYRSNVGTCPSGTIAHAKFSY